MWADFDGEVSPTPPGRTVLDINGPSRTGLELSGVLRREHARRPCGGREDMSQGSPVVEHDAARPGGPHPSGLPSPASTRRPPPTRGLDRLVATGGGWRKLHDLNPRCRPGCVPRLSQAEQAVYSSRRASWSRASANPDARPASKQGWTARRELRTRVVWEGVEALTVVEREATLPVRHLDWARGPTEERRANSPSAPMTTRRGPGPRHGQTDPAGQARIRTPR